MFGGSMGLGLPPIAAEECRELVDEGISVMPIPDILDDDRLQ